LLVLPAFAMMAAIRYHAKAKPQSPKNKNLHKAQNWQLIRWPVQEIRRIANPSGPTAYRTRTCRCRAL
jgi:hypothetical protein